MNSFIGSEKKDRPTCFRPDASARCSTLPRLTLSFGHECKASPRDNLTFLDQFVWASHHFGGLPNNSWKIWSRLGDRMVVVISFDISDPVPRGCGMDVEQESS